MIKKFNEFISEELAYLAGHRQPLYHFTQRLNAILNMPFEIFTLRNLINFLLGFS